MTKIRLTLTIKAMLLLSKNRSILFRSNDQEIELVLGREIAELETVVLPEFDTGTTKQATLPEDMN